MSTQKVSDLTVAELLELIRDAVQEVLEKRALITERELDQRGLLDIPPLSVGSWPEGLRLISREDYYEDEAR